MSFNININNNINNNTSKLTEINKRIKRDSEKLTEVENDPTYSDKQRQLYKNRVDNLNTEKQAKLEILSQNRKDLQTQVVRIKQHIEKVLEKGRYLAERICILFCEQGTTTASILTTLSMTMSTIVLAITDAFGGTGKSCAFPPKDEGALEKMAEQGSRCSQKTCWKGC